MISKNKIKEIRALERKKIRSAEGLFVTEGPKVVGDLMQKYLPQMFVHRPRPVCATILSSLRRNFSG